MRVGYYSPLPPERSGIADYSALLLPALGARLDVEVMRPKRRLGRRSSFDLALYHLGNSPEAHGWILDALRVRSGLVVLHEFVLHHLVAGVTLGRGDAAGYLDAMQRDAGAVGRMLAHGVIDGLVPPLWERRPNEYPLAREALEHADALIVHSRHVEALARETGYRGRIWRIPMPAWPRMEASPYPLEADGPVIGCLGHINPAKRLPELVAAFVRLRADFPGALLVVAGAASGVDVHRELERAGVRESAVVFDYVDEPTLWSLLAACDVCVSLRWPTMGETSAIVVRALGAGRPQVVSNVGWFSELPDDVALKVPVGEGEVDALAATLALLASSPDERRRMASAARAYAEQEHRLERVADAYAEACEETAGRRLAEDGMLTQVAVAAADVGLAPDAPALRDIGTAARELSRGE